MKNNGKLALFLAVNLCATRDFCNHAAAKFASTLQQLEKLKLEQQLFLEKRTRELHEELARKTAALQTALDQIHKLAAGQE
jgi:hypothetical protein